MYNMFFSLFYLMK